MNVYVDKLRAMRFGWNERPLTEADFLRIKRRLKFAFRRMPLKRRGYYSRTRGRDTIVISERLRGFQELFVMFHELGHVLMHAPARGEAVHFSGKCEGSREEKEADAFAYCALLPLLLLSSVPPDELVNDLGYPPAFVMKRTRIYERYGI